MKLKYVLGLAFIVVCSMAFSACDWSGKREIEKEGKVLIDKIEAFKKENGRLPETLMEIGKKQEELMGPIMYGKVSSTKYVLQAMLTMDKSYVYDSETKEWTERP